jgi:hypothetical protein
MLAEPCWLLPSEGEKRRWIVQTGLITDITVMINIMEKIAGHAQLKYKRK